MQGRRGNKVIGLIICIVIGLFFLGCGSVGMGLGLILFGLAVFIPQIIEIDANMKKYNEWRNKFYDK
jgi:hypothetical protein